MTDAGETDSAAQETIERQQREIERLTALQRDESLSERLRDALGLAAAANALGAPTTHAALLELIVQTAAQTIAAEGAALLLLNEDESVLEFEVALGGKADEVTKFRIPLGKGVAGLVALTGQPLAVSDAQADPRHDAEIARSVGYQPQNLLCVPLVSEERVVGVLELLDKRDGGSFTQTDMETLTLFARQAGIAIEQSRVQATLPSLIASVLGSVGKEGIPDDLVAAVKEFAANTESDDRYRRMLELSSLVRQIASRGETETTLCLEILESFDSYLGARSGRLGEMPMLGE